MNIPTRRQSADHEAGRPASHSSYIEGFAASYQRAAQFEPVDTRIRHDPTRRRASDGAQHTDYSRTGRRKSADVTADEDAVEGLPDEESALLGRHANTRPMSPILEESAKSTAAQTVFNITNMLVGIGLLSLPFGIMVAGWVLGTIIIMIGAAVTAYTAILLARALETNPTAYAYSDLATMAFGRLATWFTAAIFMLELLAAASALTILFGDNFHAVLPDISSNSFKVICFLIMLPATLVPLRVLSYSSVIGVLSTVILISVIFIDGLWKQEAPGSLRDPMPTSASPLRWSAFPLAIGLLMASWGGHGILPQIYTDMQDRQKFTKSVLTAYVFSTALCMFVGIIGFLMFGDDIQSEITINLLAIPGYPKTLNRIAVLMTGITSLTKAPLAIKSIAANIDVIFGLKTMKEEQSRGAKRFGGYLLVRLLVNALILVLAVCFPSFDRVMSVLGSAFVFLISVILPLLFYIRIMDRSKTRTLSQARRSGLWIMLILSSIIGLIGTVWAFIPQDL